MDRGCCCVSAGITRLEGGLVKRLDFARANGTITGRAHEVPIGLILGREDPPGAYPELSSFTVDTPRY